MKIKTKIIKTALWAGVLFAPAYIYVAAAGTFALVS